METGCPPLLNYRFVQTKIESHYTLKTLFEAIDYTLNSCKQGDYNGILIDVRDCSQLSSPVEVCRIINRITRAGNCDRNRYAFVIENNLPQIEIAQLIEFCLEQDDITNAYFFETSAAMKWLKDEIQAERSNSHPA